MCAGMTSSTTRGGYARWPACTGASDDTLSRARAAHMHAQGYAQHTNTQAHKHKGTSAYTQPHKRVHSDVARETAGSCAGACVCDGILARMDSRARGSATGSRPAGGAARAWCAQATRHPTAEHPRQPPIALARLAALDGAQMRRTRRRAHAIRFGLRPTASQPTTSPTLAMTSIGPVTVSVSTIHACTLCARDARATGRE